MIVIGVRNKALGSHGEECPGSSVVVACGLFSVAILSLRSAL